MSATTQASAKEARALCRTAHLLVVEARRGRSSGELQRGVRQVLAAFEAWCADWERAAEAGRCLQRWATAILAGRLVTADVQLGRAGLALGVRASEIQAQEQTPQPAPVAAELAPPALLQPLNENERALVQLLPPAREALDGAALLAELWGGTMSPTSARGRYSRLANKLRDHHGRDVLLRGQGRYGRRA